MIAAEFSDRSSAEKPLSHMSARCLNALILDDCPFDRRELRRAIEKTETVGNIVEVECLKDLKAALDARSFDVVFVDYMLAGETGLDALEFLASHNEGARIGRIMVTGESRAEIAMSALKNGCSDFLVKGQIEVPALRETIQNSLNAVTLTDRADRMRRVHVAFASEIAELSLRAETEIAPMASRMLDALRNLRGQSAGLDSQLDEMEAEFLRIWGFLDDFAAVGGKRPIGAC